MKKRIWHVGPQGDRYRTAIRLWGRWRIHIFWRGDDDRALHDHPNDFWTFPLKGYWENWFNPKTKCHELRRVKAWRWHFREAEYRHRVLGSHRYTNGDDNELFEGGFITLVKEGPERRHWGFWVWEINPNQWRWVYWRNYLDVQEG